MRELNIREVDEISGGNDSIGWINTASDVLTLGLAGARVLTMTTPVGLGLAGVTAAYYGGQAAGSAIADYL